MTVKIIKPGVLAENRERIEGGLNDSDLVYETFVGLWRESRKPVTAEALALVSGVGINAVYYYMRSLERSGDAVWRDGGWVPADEG